MTSEEMTTGSVSATEAERKFLASRSRWWNSTGGGSASKSSNGRGNVKAGDGGKKFQDEFPDLHQENLEWLKTRKVDMETGAVMASAEEDGKGGKSCGPRGLTRPVGSPGARPLVVDQVGGSWLRRNKLLVFGGLVIAYVLMARILGATGSESR